MTDYGKSERESFLTSLYSERKSLESLWSATWPAIMWVLFILFVWVMPDLIAWFTHRGVVGV